MPKRSSEEDIKEEGNLNFNFGSEKKDIDEKEESVINGANDEDLDSVKSIEEAVLLEKKVHILEYQF